MRKRGDFIDKLFNQGGLFLAIGLLFGGTVLFYMMLVTLTEKFPGFAAFVSVMMILYFVGAGYVIRVVVEEGEGDP